MRSNIFFEMKENVRRFNLISDVVALIYFLIYLFLSYSIISSSRSTRLLLVMTIIQQVSRQTDVKFAASSILKKRSKIAQKQFRKTVSIKKKNVRKTSIERKKTLKKYKIKRKNEKTNSNDKSKSLNLNIHYYVY